MVGMLEVAVALVAAQVPGDEAVVVVDAQPVGVAPQGQALRTATAPETVDSAVIEHFLQHHCACWCGAPTFGKRYTWRKRRSSRQVMRIVRFLEQTGRVATSGDLDDNLRIVDAFLARLRCQGYARKTIRSYSDNAAVSVGGTWGTMLGGDISGVVRE